MKIKVIGNPEFVQGFALNGVSGSAAQTADQVHAAMDSALKEPNLGLILVSEDAAALLGKRLKALIARVEPPVLITLPGPGQAESGMVNIKDLVTDAIGVGQVKARA